MNEEPSESSSTDESQHSSEDTHVSRDTFLTAVEAIGRPVVTAGEVAAQVNESHADTVTDLDHLAATGSVDRIDVSADPVVYYPSDWGELADRERVIVFPERRQLVVDDASQFTRARIASMARLEATAQSDGALYEIHREDIWNAPYDDFESLRTTLRSIVGQSVPALEEWMADQWRRAHRFRLYSHEEGYVVLEAASESLMEDIATGALEDELRAVLDETTAWVASDQVAAVKRTLYEAGYPVEDDRDLSDGDPLDVDLRLSLRDYQQTWVNRFSDKGAGVLVGPPGSGKTIAALGIMAEIGGETLVLVPSRELASQWETVLSRDTTLTTDEIGLYHGGRKEIRPVTIATYQIAGMDRHRALFEEREWGLIIFDEVHHIPAPVHRRTADIQTRHRLGLSATPVREDDRESDIYALIGPPIGTDWSSLFESGHVQSPTVEIRYVPWKSDLDRHEYDTASGHEARQIAATNPAKDDEVLRLRARHDDAKTLVFVDYLSQGERLADRLDVPFLSGETPHSERRRLLREFGDGERETLVISRVGDEGLDIPDAEVAIVASGLGGSRRQGAQRAGRTMRPAGGSQMYILATRGTEEEDHATRRTNYLAARGIRIRESAVETASESS